MDSLPVETLQQIFKLACTDGGYTGCSLALTSKFVQEAARSTRFHSITLEGDTARLAALVTLYQDQRSSAVRPRTSYLYLSFQRKVTGSQFDKPPEDEWDENEDEGNLSPSESSSVPARFITARQLFTLVADDLESLVLMKDFFTANRSLFDCPFPSLRDLTLVRHTDPSRLIPPESLILPLFPSLTHLHLVAPEYPRPLLAGWAAHAPRVTHLRISAYGRMYQLLDELPNAVGTPEYPFKRGFRVGVGKTMGPAPAVRTYPTLTRVVVEPGSPPAKGWCGTSRVAFSQRNMQLRWIAGRAREAGVEMYVPEPRARNEQKFDEAIRTEWLKRIGGEPNRDWFSGGGEEDSEDQDEETDTQ